MWLPVLFLVTFPLLVTVPDLDASTVEDVRGTDEPAAAFADALMPDVPASGEEGNDLFF